MDMSMNKKVCRKYAGQPLQIGPNHGLLHAEAVQWLVTTDIKLVDHHRTLILNVYSREAAAKGNLAPKWTMFHVKDNYITLEYKNDGNTAWRTSCFERLSDHWDFINRCAFVSLQDEQRVTHYFRDDKRGGFSCLLNRQRGILAQRKAKRQQKIQRKISQRMRNVPAIPKGLNEWVRRQMMPAYFFYDYKKGRKVVTGVCSACGQEIELAGVKYNAKGICPHCGRELTMKSRGRMGYLMDHSTCQVIQKTAPDELVIRIFKAYNNPVKSELGIYESARQFIRQNPNGTLAFEEYYMDYKQWKKGKRPVFFCYQYNFEADTCGHVYCGNLPNAMKGTPWQYCPVKAFYEHFREPMEMSSFLAAHVTHPKLEHLIKTGFCDLASDLAYRSHNVILDESKNRTHQILRVAHEDIPFLRGVNIGAAQLSDFQKYFERNLKDRQNLFLWQTEHKISHIERNILPFMEFTAPHKFMRYVDTQAAQLKERLRYGVHRFSKTSDVVQEYSDYLDMCKKQNYDLKNDFILFPKDLEQAHDRVARQIKLKADAKMRRDFRAAMKRVMSHLDFEMDGMTICYPQNPEEILKEGQELHHCVGTYVDRVARQECIIVFLRQTAQVDKPFYTLEIRNRKVIQARTTRNAPATPEVQHFIETWERKVLQVAA